MQSSPPTRAMHPQPRHPAPGARLYHHRHHPHVARSTMFRSTASMSPIVTPGSGGAPPNATGSGYSYHNERMRRSSLAVSHADAAPAATKRPSPVTTRRPREPSEFEDLLDYQTHQQRQQHDSHHYDYHSYEHHEPPLGRKHRALGEGYDERVPERAPSENWVMRYPPRHLPHLAPVERNPTTVSEDSSRNRGNAAPSTVVRASTHASSDVVAAAAAASTVSPTQPLFHDDAIADLTQEKCALEKPAADSPRVQRLRRDNDMVAAAVSTPTLRNENEEDRSYLRKRCRELESRLQSYRAERKCYQWRVHRLETTVKLLREAQEQEQHLQEYADSVSGAATLLRGNTMRHQDQECTLGKDKPGVALSPVSIPSPHTTTAAQHLEAEDASLEGQHERKPHQDDPYGRSPHTPHLYRPYGPGYDEYGYSMHHHNLQQYYSPYSYSHSHRYQPPQHHPLPSQPYLLYHPHSYHRLEQRTPWGYYPGHGKNNGRDVEKPRVPTEVTFYDHLKGFGWIASEEDLSDNESEAETEDEEDESAEGSGSDKENDEQVAALAMACLAQGASAKKRQRTS